MAKTALNNTANNWEAALNANMTSGQLTAILKASGATGAPDAPFIAKIDSEFVLVSVVATDTPSAGLDTLTIERAYDGSAASTHLADAAVSNVVSAALFNELKTELDNLRTAFFFIHGDDGVQRSASGTDLLTEETTGTATMGVIVGAGFAMVDGQPVGGASQFASALMVAPTVNPRIDTVQVAQDGTISILTGVEAGSPTARAVSASNLLLAWIYHVVGETIIEDSDGGDGYIVDKRAFL